VADLIVADLAAAPPTAAKPGGLMVDALLAERGVRSVDLAGWQRINAWEVEHAKDGRPRKKLTSWNELLEIARAAPGP